jgi:hypothetical protein
MERQLNPSDATLTTIARQILENRTAENMQFWFVYGALAIVLAAIVAVTTAYFLERGKLLAATNTLAGRLDEIRKSTDASERIKTSIAHNDWTVKEFKTLRRTKLEQLTTASYKLLLASEVDAKFTLEDEKYSITSREFTIDVHQISAMYFTVFKVATDAVISAHANLATWLIESRSKQRQQDLTVKHEKGKLDTLLSVPGNMVHGLTATAQRSVYENARTELMNLKIAYANEYPQYYAPLRKSVDNLQESATALMNELTTPTTV